jgi:hypothetical protein
MTPNPLSQAILMFEIFSKSILVHGNELILLAYNLSSRQIDDEFRDYSICYKSKFTLIRVRRCEFFA